MMFRLTSFLLFAVVGCLSGYAQSSSKSVALNILAGPNLSSMSGENSLDYNVKTMFGLTGGVNLEINLNKQIALKPGVLYARQGNHTDYGFYGEDKRLNYLNIPFLLRIKPRGGDFGFLVGPQYGILLSAQSDRTNGPKTDMKDRCKSSDISAIIGMEVSPKTSRFGVMFSYQRSFTNVYTTNYDGTDLKPVAFTILLQYRLFSDL